MPELKSKNITLAFDMAGCPNRCKHCWLGHPPNGKIPKELVKQVTESFSNWLQDEKPYFESVTVNTWYREPDYLDNYDELWEFEKDLSDKPMRFDLLSIWRLARDDKYAKWAKEVGTKVCQISFFGLEENTDYFTGRRGAFRDNIIASDRLLEQGIIPRWQYFLSEKNIHELEAFVNLIKEHRLEERVQALGGEFRCFMHIPSPDGECFKLEDIRPTKAIYENLPQYMVDQTLKHFEVDKIEEIIGVPESDLLPELLNDHSTFDEYPDLALMITPELDVYPNTGEPLEWWCLGNMNEDSVDTIMSRFINNEVLGLKMFFEMPISDFAKKYGRKDGQQVYLKEDLIRRWIRMWGEELHNI